MLLSVHWKKFFLMKMSLETGLLLMREGPRIFMFAITYFNDKLYDVNYTTVTRYKMESVYIYRHCPNSSNYLSNLVTDNEFIINGLNKYNLTKIKTTVKVDNMLSAIISASSYMVLKLYLVRAPGRRGGGSIKRERLLGGGMGCD